MFTGLVEDVGRVSGLAGEDMARLSVRAYRVLEGTRVGDSVSVNGVCLTVNELGAGTLAFYAMAETLRRTAVGALAEGDPVNLESAMGAQGRVGRHIVRGRVYGVEEVLDVLPEGDAEIWEFKAPAQVVRYTVEKGSICVDGISLTVVALTDTSFTVSILPQTRARTNLKELRPGDRVNLEADVVGKYVERLLEPRLTREMKNLKRSVEDAV